jgi:hypothetical protein
LHMHICNMDCHEAGLCCYLVIHIENLLHTLQMFYFYLWPIYWISLIFLSGRKKIKIYRAIIVSTDQ